MLSGGDAAGAFLPNPASQESHIKYPALEHPAVQFAEQPFPQVNVIGLKAYEVAQLPDVHYPATVQAKQLSAHLRHEGATHEYPD